MDDKFLLTMRTLDFSQMRRLSNELKIFQPIIMLNCVNVMNKLLSTQIPSQMLFHDQSVFHDVATTGKGVLGATNQNVAVFVFISSWFGFVITGLGAKLGFLRWPGQKVLGTLQTLFSRLATLPVVMLFWRKFFARVPWDISLLESSRHMPIVYQNHYALGN